MVERLKKAEANNLSIETPRVSVPRKVLQVQEIVYWLKKCKINNRMTNYFLLVDSI